MTEEEDPKEGDPSNDQPILPFIDWAKVSIPEECADPGSEPIMVIIEDSNNSGNTLISAINRDMTTDNWMITPHIVRKREKV